MVMYFIHINMHAAEQNAWNFSYD